jgi:RNA polymerase sigma factor (sigma-70 family)
MLKESVQESLTTAELVELARAGNEDAYAQLHERYNRRLLAGLRRSMPAELAEDAAQEAWIRAFERLRDLDQPDSFFPWLATIARNSARTALRAFDGRTINLGDWERETLDSQTDPYRVAELREREAAARAALRRLPERQRRALQLRWIDGQSYRAIATATGQSVSAIETLLYRARSNFHKQYESALSGLEPSDDFACYKIRSHIRRLSEGLLSERRRVRVLSHLGRCERCRAVHERMGESWETRGWLAGLPLPALLRDLVAWLGARFAPTTPHLGGSAAAHLGSGVLAGAGVAAVIMASADGTPQGPSVTNEEDRTPPVQSMPASFDAADLAASPPGEADSGLVTHSNSTGMTSTGSIAMSGAPSEPAGSAATSPPPAPAEVSQDVAAGEEVDLLLAGVTEVVNDATTLVGGAVAETQQLLTATLAQVDQTLGLSEAVPALLPGLPGP